MREVVVLGSTGSIGRQTLEVIAERLDEFKVVALAAGGSSPALIAEQGFEDLDGPVVRAEGRGCC